MKEPRPTLEIIKNRAIQQAAPLYRGAVIGWIKEAKKMKSYDSPINPELPGTITELINKTLLVTWAMGRDVAEDKIQVLKRAEERAKNGKKAEFAIWQDIPWNSLGFNEALKIFKGKPIISADDFKEAEAAIKAIAFSVQRVEEANALILLKESIAKSIDTGIVFRDWKNALPGLFERAGYVVTDPKLTPWHLETVFRTNQSSVYESANWDHYQNDDYIIGLMYTTVGDNRVRGDHAVFNGFMAPKNDPIWTEINPPNDYQCRCSTTPLSKFFMEQNGFTFTEQKGKNIEEAIGKAVHEHFSGKNGILHLDKKILRGLKEKYRIIERVKKEIAEIMPAKTKAEAIERLRSLGIKNIDSKMNLNSMNLTYENLTRLTGEGYDFNYTDILSLNSKKIIARSSETRLSVSNYFTGNIDRFKKILLESQKKQWLASVRGKESIPSIFSHEYAHHMTNRLLNKPFEAMSETEKLIKQKIREAFDKYKAIMMNSANKALIEKSFISRYAKTNINEFTAEAFTMYKHSDNPSPLAVQVGELIDKYFKKGAK